LTPRRLLLRDLLIIFCGGLLSSRRVLRIGILVTKVYRSVVRNTLLLIAAGRFISENGIVAVLGDENQFVRSDM